ncbi:hypothetical protein ACOMHN_024092 [Nucella lapillus]
MNRGMFWMVVVLMGTLSIATEDQPDESADNARFVREMVVRAHQKLTTGLYKTFARKPGNLILSPWSVMTLLTVTYMVAGGRTANEIGDHLNINLLRRKEILAGFEHLNEIFKNTGNDSTERLQSLNGALLGRNLRPSHRLKKLLRNNLHTYLHRIIRSPNPNPRDGPGDNRTGGAAIPRGLRGVKTPGQLQGLVPGGEGLESSLSLWLFNWMSFQGAWRTPFPPSQTHTADFYVEGRDPVEVATMVTRAQFPRSHYPEMGLTLLELPYGHAGRHALVLLLPDQVDGLPRLEKKLRHFSLESMLAEPHWVRLAKVFLPKFKFRTDVMLTDVMKKLGFRRMFSPKEADFTRLKPRQKNSRKSPYVQTMIHRAAIEVNENGTIASASTALKVTSRKYVHYFRVNRPFLFVLRDKTLGINLFIGRVTDPRQLS